MPDPKHFKIGDGIDFYPITGAIFLKGDGGMLPDKGYGALEVLLRKRGVIPRTAPMTAPTSDASEPPETSGSESSESESDESDVPF